MNGVQGLKDAAWLDPAPRVKVPRLRADAFCTMRRRSTLDRIQRAFAEAVEEGDFAQAEGWLAVARLHDDRARAGRSASRRRPRGEPVGRKA